MGDEVIRACDNVDAATAAKWALMEHRADVLDMARAVASGWYWGEYTPDSYATDSVIVAKIAAAIVAAVDDALDGDA